MTPQRLTNQVGAIATAIALTACSTHIFSRSPAAAPDTDIYVMVDTSPSMEIAATSAGMASLNAATARNQGGCALACHQSDKSAMGVFAAADGAQISCVASGAYVDGTTFRPGAKFPSTGRDSYDLARCLGAPVRIDLVRDAVQNLVETAAMAAESNRAAYRIALFETDTNQPDPADDLKLYPLQPLTGDLSAGGAAYVSASKIVPLEMLTNNQLSPGDDNLDKDTDLDTDLVSINGLIPATGKSASAPREVLFIVTDGLNDTGASGWGAMRSYTPMDWSGANCRAIKQRGVRVAVLYTTYTPLPNDSWYRVAVAPALAKGLPPGLPPSTPVGSDPMALAAQQCASPGLYEQVGTDGDISAAMRTLFHRAVPAERTGH